MFHVIEFMESSLWKTGDIYTLAALMLPVSNAEHPESLFWSRFHPDEQNRGPDKVKAAEKSSICPNAVSAVHLPPESP